MELYEYKQNPHIRERLKPGLDSDKSLSFNERIGLKITSLVGTMAAAYIFALLSMISLPAAIASGSTIILVSWVAQTFLQLVLLPIIIVGQNIQAKKSERRALATYLDADAILHENREIQNHLRSQDEKLNKLEESLSRLKQGSR